MIAGFSIWVCGLGSVLSFSLLAELKPLGSLNIDLNIFDLIDYAVANLLLPINALLIAAFSGWVIKSNVVKEQFSSESNDWRVYWRFTNRYIAPIAIGAVLIDLLFF
jgi:NSS family neurotransmitter:Na+ symporter